MLKYSGDLKELCLVKNTLTGALNVISAKPIIGGDDISGKVSIAASDEDGGTEVEGHLNIPLSDAFAVRLAWQDREKRWNH